MLFDFKKFISELREDSKKKETIEKYEKYYGLIDDDIKKQYWFVDYISKLFPYYEAANCPQELEDDFDWQLLFSLIVGSFSSKFELIKPNKLINAPNEKVDVNIYVTYKEKSLKKSLNELWSFQILKLYEVYIEEQIGIQLLIAENEDDMINCYNERIEKISFIKNYNSTFKNISLTQEKDNENYIYHYTTFNTINEILKSNSLRACDVKRLNDRMEHRIWFDTFNNAIDKFRVKMDAEKYMSFLEKINKTIYLYKDLDCYVTCLSKEKDLLSQWRAYGDDGQGVAIAFDTKELLNCLYEFNDPKSNFNLLNGYIEYNYNFVFNDLINQISELLRNYVSTNLSIEDYFNRVDNLKNFEEKTRRIFMRMQDLKDSSFREEREFRLFWQQEKNNTVKTISSFERNNRIIPYINLSFGDKKIPIKEIILGPALTEKEDRKENIIEVLQRYGYNTELIKISNSNIPYRK